MYFSSSFDIFSKCSAFLYVFFQKTFKRLPQTLMNLRNFVVFPTGFLQINLRFVFRWLRGVLK